MSARLNNSAVSAGQNVISPVDVPVITSTPRRSKPTLSTLTPQSSREHIHLSSSSSGSLLPSRSRQALLPSSSTSSLTSAVSSSSQLSSSSSSSLLPSIASASFTPRPSALHPYETHMYSTTTPAPLPNPLPATTVLARLHSPAPSSPPPFSPAVARIIAAAPSASIQSSLSSTIARSDVLLRALEAEEEAARDSEAGRSGVSLSVRAAAAVGNGAAPQREGSGSSRAGDSSSGATGRRIGSGDGDTLAATSATTSVSSALPTSALTHAALHHPALPQHQHYQQLSSPRQATALAHQPALERIEKEGKVLGKGVGKGSSTPNIPDLGRHSDGDSDSENGTIAPNPTATFTPASMSVLKPSSSTSSIASSSSLYSSSSSSVALAAPTSSSSLPHTNPNAGISTKTTATVSTLASTPVASKPPRAPRVVHSAHSTRKETDAHLSFRSRYDAHAEYSGDNAPSPRSFSPGKLQNAEKSKISGFSRNSSSLSASSPRAGARRSRRPVPVGVHMLETIDSDDENEQETAEVTSLLLSTLDSTAGALAASNGALGSNNGALSNALNVNVSANGSASRAGVNNALHAATGSTGSGDASGGVTGSDGVGAGDGLFRLSTDKGRDGAHSTSSNAASSINNNSTNTSTASTAAAPAVYAPLPLPTATPLSPASSRPPSPSHANAPAAAASLVQPSLPPHRHIFAASPPVGMNAAAQAAKPSHNTGMYTGADASAGPGASTGERVLGFGRPLWQGGAGSSGGTATNLSAGAGVGVGSAEALMASSYRELSDESAELARALKHTQGALRQLREDFHRVAAGSLRHQANVEKIIEVLSKKDSRLRDRKERIDNLQGVVANLNSEKRELLVQVSESSKRVTRLEEKCQALVEHNAQLHGDVQAVSTQAEQMLQMAAKARQEGKEQRAMEREVGKLQDELQRSKLDLIHLQNKYNNLLRSHTLYEYESTSKIESLTHEVEHRRRELLHCHEEMVDLQKKHIDLRDLYNQLQQQYNDLQSKHNALLVTLQEKTTQCSKLEYDLADIRTLRDAALAKIDAYKLDMRDKEERISSLEGEVEVLRREMEGMREQLKSATEERRVAQQEHRKFKVEQSKAVQSTANLRSELDALSLQYESMKEKYALLSATLEDYKKLAGKLQSESKEFEKIRDAHSFSTNELQRLTLKLKELKASSDAQIVSLTDSRDRYLQQVELLRAKNASLNQTVESQKHDLKRFLMASDKTNEELERVTRERDLLESQLMGAVGEKVLVERNIRKNLAECETELSQVRGELTKERARVLELEEEVRRRDKRSEKEEEKGKTVLGREGLQAGLGLLELKEQDTHSVRVQGPMLTPSNNAYVSHGGDAASAMGRKRRSKAKRAQAPEDDVVEEEEDEDAEEEEESAELKKMRKELAEALQRAEDAENKYSSQSLRLAQSEHSVEVMKAQVADAHAHAEQMQQESDQRVALLHKKIAELEAVVSKYRQKSVQGVY